MSLIIDEASDRRSLREFVDLPFRLYSGDPIWVPPVKHFVRQLFDTRRHPFHEHAEVAPFLARDSRDRVVGRVCAILNRAHNEYQHDRTGFFGFFETENDPEIAGALLSRCAGWLAARGLDSMTGPFNFSTNEECGLLVEGFDGPPLVMMPYNPPWYGGLIEGCGCTKVMDLYAYWVDAGKNDVSRLQRVGDIAAGRPGLTLRDLSVKHISHDLPIIMDIYNECWRDNWGFVPLTVRELDRMAEELKMILVPGLAPIIEVDGTPVAFAVALPDSNQLFRKAGGSLIRAVLALRVPPFRVRMDRVRVLLLGVRKAYRGRGLEALLISRIIAESSRLGMGRGEMSWILEDNQPMRRILERVLGAVHYRTYRIYGRKLPGGPATPAEGASPER
jgi:GNAT superfamily N-acetyltransferase